MADYSFPSSLSPSTSKPEPFYIPGPSSRFNTKHVRAQSSQHISAQRTTTPISPSLSTERRAQHRRVYSSVNVPTRATFTTGLNGDSPLRRFTSYIATTMASEGRAQQTVPVTPSTKQNNGFKAGVRLQDSPFSDYFTDDGRSPTVDEASFPAPSAETQQLLVRLNHLQAQLVRGGEDSMNIIGRAIGQIESQLNAVHSQTRMPPELEDSGLFMDDEEDEDEGEGEQLSSEMQHDDPFADEVTSEKKRVENDFLLLEAQNLLHSVTTAQTQLRERLAELRSLNETLTPNTESQHLSISTLHEENAALRADVACNKSELLYLRLQFQALELEVETSDEAARKLEAFAPQLRDEIQKVKRDRVEEEMGKWKLNWEKVEEQMKDSSTRELIPEDGVGASPAGEDGNAVEDLARRMSEDELVDGLGIAAESQELAADEDTLHVEPEAESLDQTPLEPIEYTSKSTQTDSDDISWLFPNAEGDASPTKDSTDTSYMGEHDDCAITTSSEGDYSYLSDEDEGGLKPTATLASPVGGISSAWQELWTGLSSLAGMGDERF